MTTPMTKRAPTLAESNARLDSLGRMGSPSLPQEYADDVRATSLLAEQHTHVAQFTEADVERFFSDWVRPRGARLPECYCGAPAVARIRVPCVAAFRCAAHKAETIEELRVDGHDVMIDEVSGEGWVR